MKNCGFDYLGNTVFCFIGCWRIQSYPKKLPGLPDVIILIMRKILYFQAKKNRWERTPMTLFFLAILLLGITSAIYNNVAGVT